MKQETEMERLKRNADEARVQQKFEALYEYLSDCVERSNNAFYTWERWKMYEFAALLNMMCVAGCTYAFDLSPIFFEPAWVLWLMVYIGIVSFVEHARNKAEAEFSGALNALDKLGFLDHINNGTRRRKPRERFKTILEELWARTKQLARDRAYGWA